MTTDRLSFLPNHRTIRWQSEDGMMEAGSVRDNLHYDYVSLGNRPITLSDIQAFIYCLEQPTSTDPVPLLLLSCCPGFDATASNEAEGLVFYAGQYRALQQHAKAQGRLLLSYIHHIAVGGVYLMHGLSAHHRAAAPDTQFHDTVPSRPVVPLPAVLEQGLIDAIVTQAEFHDWLQCHVSRALL